MRNRRYMKLISVITVLLCVTVLAGFSFKKAPVYEFNEQGAVTKATEYFGLRKVKSVTTNEYDSNGDKTQSKTVYYKENGEVDYTFVREFADGGKKTLDIVSFSDGRSKFNHYDANGNKILTYHAEFGIETYREEMEYDPFGRLIAYTDYVNGKFRNSYTKEYYPSGKLACEVFYDEEGKEQGVRYFDESGNPVNSRPASLPAPAPAATATPEAAPMPELKELTAIRYPGRGVDSLREVEVDGLEATSGLEMTEAMEPVRYVCDGDMKTAWYEDVDGYGVGEVLVLFFDGEKEIDAFSIFPGFQESDEAFGENLRPKTLLVSVSDGRSCSIELDDGKFEHFYYFSEKVKTDYLEIVIKEVYTEGAQFENTAISEIKVYEDTFRTAEGQQTAAVPEESVALYISADYAEEYMLSGGEYHHYSDGQKYREPIAIRTYIPLRNVEFFKYEIIGGDFRPGENLYTLPELTKDKPLVVEVEFPGDLTTYGIRLVDDKGNSHTYSMYISGKDGSLVLTEE